MPYAVLRALSAALVLAAAAYASPAVAADGQIAWEACPGQSDWQCGALTVPLDRGGVLEGTVTLSLARLPASVDPGRRAVVALAGGPGQAALPLRSTVEQVLRPARADHDLLVFDQRGIGRSGPLTCPSLSRRSSMRVAVRDCALELGPARGLYRTVDTVADLEAIRAAAGYGRLALFGVSYGTKVATAYAGLHPDRVEALVLDSVVLPDGPDPLRPAVLRSTPRVLADLCDRSACRRITPSVRGDLDRLLARLDSGDLRGTVVDSRGRRRRATLDVDGLVRLLLAGDFDPLLRSNIPAALRSARQGDPAPLLRMAGPPPGDGGGEPGTAGISLEVMLATTCEEVPFPWPRTAGFDARVEAAAGAMDRLSRADLGPFPAIAVPSAGAMQFCLPWPNATAEPLSMPSPPPVPTLILSGRMDLRTPVEDARRLLAMMPQAQLRIVPWAGHSVAAGYRDRCVTEMLGRFFAGLPAASCPATGNPYPPRDRPPRSLSGVRPVAGAGTGLRARAVAAVIETVDDARTQAIGAAVTGAPGSFSLGGLRAGTVSVRISGRTMSLRLRRYEYVPGLAVSGTLDSTGGRMTVRGRGLRGRIRFARDRTWSGRVNGRRVASARAAALRRAALTVAPPPFR